MLHDFAIFLIKVTFFFFFFKKAPKFSFIKMRNHIIILNVNAQHFPMNDLENKNSACLFVIRGSS